MENNEVSFVVHTNSYSGNFEREMCAHITGQTGECEVGSNYVEGLEELAELYKFISRDKLEEVTTWIEDHIRQVSDENGCYRPCAIAPTPGRTNDGYGRNSDVTEENPMKYPAYESVEIYFDEIPPQSVIDFMKMRALDFTAGGGKMSYISVKGFSLQRKVVKVEIEEFPHLVIKL